MKINKTEYLIITGWRQAALARRKFTWPWLVFKFNACLAPWYGLSLTERNINYSSTSCPMVCIITLSLNGSLIYTRNFKNMKLRGLRKDYPSNVKLARFKPIISESILEVGLLNFQNCFLDTNYVHLKQN